MPPYKQHATRRTFQIIDKSGLAIIMEIVDWLDYIMSETKFYNHNYTIYAGREIINYLRTILTVPGYDNEQIMHFLDIDRVLLYDLISSTVDHRTIRINWSEPVSGCLTGAFFIDTHHDAWKNPCCVPQIKKVIYNPPATIIYWADDTKTVVQCQEGDIYDSEKGLALAIAKKALGNTPRKLNDVLHKWKAEKEEK